MSQYGAEESDSRGASGISSRQSVQGVPADPWSLRHLPGQAGASFPASSLLVPLPRLSPVPQSGEQALQLRQPRPRPWSGQAQLARLVLPALVLQLVEGILHALARGGQLVGETTALASSGTPAPSSPRPANVELGPARLDPQGHPVGRLVLSNSPMASWGVGPIGTSLLLWGYRGWGPRVTAPAWSGQLSLGTSTSSGSCVGPDPDTGLPHCPDVQGDLQREGLLGNRGPRGSQRVLELKPEPERLPCVEGEGAVRAAPGWGGG